MKKFILVLLSFLGMALIADAQSPTAPSYNGSLKIEQTGVSQGYPVIKITNLTSTEQHVQIQYKGASGNDKLWEDIAVIQPNGYYTTTVTNPLVLYVYAKTVTSSDNTWILLTINLKALPIRAGSLNVDYLGSGRFRIEFDTYDTVPGTSFTIQLSTDGTNWHPVHVITAGTEPNKHYSQIVTIKGERKR